MWLDGEGSGYSCRVEERLGFNSHQMRRIPSLLCLLCLRSHGALPFGSCNVEHVVYDVEAGQRAAAVPTSSLHSRPTSSRLSWARPNPGRRGLGAQPWTATLKLNWKSPRLHHDPRPLCGRITACQLHLLPSVTAFANLNPPVSPQPSAIARLRQLPLSTKSRAPPYGSRLIPNACTSISNDIPFQPILSRTCAFSLRQCPAR